MFFAVMRRPASSQMGSGGRFSIMRPLPREMAHQPHDAAGRPFRLPVTRAAGVVLFVAVLALATASAGPAATPSVLAQANIAVAVTGSDTTCARGKISRPCSTLLRAYQIARCGDVIRVTAGSYPAQNLGHSGVSQNVEAKDCSAKRTPVTFIGNSRERVSFAGVTIGEPWVALRNVTTSTVSVVGWDSSVGCYRHPVTNVSVSSSVVDGMAGHLNVLWMANVQHISLSGNTIGNVTTGESEISNAAPAPCPNNDHLVFTGNTWHDFRNPNGAADHMECLQFDALAPGTSNDNIVLQGNRFENCGQFDVFVSGPMKNWLIQNNYFERACSKQAGTGCVVAGGALSLSPDYTNVTGQFNTFAVNTYPQFSISEGTQSGGVWRYNINGSFPTSIHCGAQNKWALTGNIDAGPYVCPGDTGASGRTRLVLLDSSYHGRSLRAQVGVVSARRLRVQLTIYRSGKKASAALRRPLSIDNSPTLLAWRNPGSTHPTRMCARAIDDGGSVVASTCSRIK